MMSLRFAAPVLATLLTAASSALPGDASHGHHKMAMVPEGAPAPTLALKAMEDTTDGFNLHLLTENFEFTPEMAGHASDKIGGHAHLYVNGTKIGRIYSNWVHVPTKFLDNGNNEIRVTLNNNMHGEWVVAGEPVAAVIELMNHGDGHGEYHDTNEQAHSH